MEKVLLFTVVMKGVVRSLTLVIKFVTIARRRNASKRIATSCRIEIIGCNKEGKATKISSEANVAKNYYSDGEDFFSGQQLQPGEDLVFDTACFFICVATEICFQRVKKFPKLW